MMWYARAPTTAFMLLSLSFRSSTATAEKIDCYATCGDNGICTYTAKVNLHAGELGYFQFEECGDIINPTIAMEVGKVYKFIQTDRTNYFHPLGFAYYPDGAHDGKDELEPGIVPPGSSSTCSVNNTCPAPMYFRGGEYLGMYSNLPPPLVDGEDIAISRNADPDGFDDFGLDHYEPLFFHPLGDWLSYGDFEIMLYFDDDAINQDIFYFCHIHQYMTGRIKLVDRNGDPLVADFIPPLGYKYDEVSEFDKKCGTFNTSSYQLPNDQCPDRFVCDVAEGNPVLAEFSECLDAMNCAMMVGMTTDATSEIGLFIHQMIPHHQNAVNMAKALLKTGLKCEDLTNEDDPTCIMESMMYEIINGQNAQIQAMRAVLEALGEPGYADCVVPVFGQEQGGDSVEESSAIFFYVGGNLIVLVLLLSTMAVF